MKEHKEDTELRPIENTEATRLDILAAAPAAPPQQQTEAAPQQDDQYFLAKPYANSIEAMTALFGKSPDDTKSVTQPDGTQLVTNTYSVDGTLVQMVLQEIENATDTLTVGAHKLYSVAAVQLKKQNHADAIRKGQKPNYRVALPLPKYLHDKGYEIEPASDSKADRRKAIDARNNGIKSLEKDLDALNRLSINVDNYNNTPSKRTRGFMRFFATVGHVQDDYILLTFNPDIADILLRAPISRYSASLLGLDERKPAAYYIGNRLSFHAGMDTNRTKGTNHSIRIENLIRNCPGIPSYDELIEKKDTRHWKARIKRAFEPAREALHDHDTLLDWYYQKGKGEILENEAAYNFKNYTEWSQTLIYFTLCNDIPDDRAKVEIADRWKRRKEKIAAARARSHKKKRVTKTS